MVVWYLTFAKGAAMRINHRGRTTMQMLVTCEERMNQAAGTRDWATKCRAKARALKGTGAGLYPVYDRVATVNHARVERLARIFKALAEMYARDTLRDVGIQVG